jgi:hypothetical protein
LLQLQQHRKLWSQLLLLMLMLQRATRRPIVLPLLLLAVAVWLSQLTAVRHVYVVVAAACLMRWEAGMLTLLLLQQAVVLWMAVLPAAAWSFGKCQLTVCKLNCNRARNYH